MMMMTGSLDKVLYYLRYISVGIGSAIAFLDIDDRHGCVLVLDMDAKC